MVGHAGPQPAVPSLTVPSAVRQRLERLAWRLGLGGREHPGSGLAPGSSPPRGAAWPSLAAWRPDVHQHRSACRGVCSWLLKISEIFYSGNFNLNKVKQCQEIRALNLVGTGRTAFPRDPRENERAGRSSPGSKGPSSCPRGLLPAPGGPAVSLSGCRGSHLLLAHLVGRPAGLPYPQWTDGVCPPGPTSLHVCLQAPTALSYAHLRVLQTGARGRAGPWSLPCAQSPGPGRQFRTRRPRSPAGPRLTVC